MTASFSELFGLTFHIDSHRVGGKIAPRPQLADVKVVLLNTAPLGLESDEWRPRFQSPEFVIAETASGNWVRITYCNGPSFAVATNGSEVRASWSPPTTLDDVKWRLFSSVMGLLLYIRGFTCLHASAIAYRRKALVFAGAAETGKSTLAAAFARIGHRVLTDDLLIVDRHESSILARPGIPRIALWPPSVEHLWGRRDALPREVVLCDKRSLDLASHSLFQNMPLPIGAVYLLSDRDMHAELRIDPVSGTNTVLALIANKYVTRYSEREQCRRDFILLSELAASAPVRRIARNDRLADLDASCDAILADFESLEHVPV